MKKVEEVNVKIAVFITNWVGTMWMAYAFTLLALMGLPQALEPGGVGLIQWFAQTFLQLVLLSVILVGQNVQSDRQDRTLTRLDWNEENQTLMMKAIVALLEHAEEQDGLIAQNIGEMRRYAASDAKDIDEIRDFVRELKFQWGRGSCESDPTSSGSGDGH
ncbi:MAG: hypothetical protein KGL39_30070 [Patescibacteria group bacterium]|nr:hypothetical protein [Patescibacteria group bacterium]